MSEAFKLQREKMESRFRKEINTVVNRNETKGVPVYLMAKVLEDYFV